MTNEQILTEAQELEFAEEAAIEAANEASEAAQNARLENEFIATWGPATQELMAEYRNINITEEQAATFCRAVIAESGRRLGSQLAQILGAAVPVEDVSLEGVEPNLRPLVPHFVDFLHALRGNA